MATQIIDKIELGIGESVEFVAGDTYIIQTYTSGTWNGDSTYPNSFYSSLPGVQSTIVSPSGVSVSYTTWQDINNTGFQISALDDTSINLGNNIGILFPTIVADFYYISNSVINGNITKGEKILIANTSIDAIIFKWSTTWGENSTTISPTFTAPIFTNSGNITLSAYDSENRVRVKSKNLIFNSNYLAPPPSSALLNFGTYTGFSDVPNGWMTKTAGTQGDPYASERELVDLLITEAYNKTGVTLTYHIVSFNISVDPLFGEDNNRTIERKFDVMGYYQLPREEKLWQKFGLQGLDQFSINVSKRHFKSASQYDFSENNPIGYDEYIPKIGDLLIAQYNNYIYEIVDIKEETGLALLSKQHIWELIVKPFKDEHLNLNSSTSATMTQIQPYVNKNVDVLDLKSNIQSKESTVIYNPSPTEKSSVDFWN